MRIAILLVFLCSCGLGLADATGTGNENLPFSGAGPYAKLPVDFETPASEPFVAFDRFAHFRNPSALAKEDIGFQIWFERLPAGETDTEEIWTVEISELTEGPDALPTFVLGGDMATWEEGTIRSPTVRRVSDEHLVMFYEGGVTDVAIGRADSFNGGLTWEKHSANPIIENGRSPGLGIVEENRWVLAYALDGQQDIFVSDSTDLGESWTLARTVLSPRSDLEGTYDQSDLDQPEFLIVENTIGARRIHLHFQGNRPDDEGPITSIGHAGSFTGQTWQREGTDAALNSGVPSEFGPSVVLEETRGVLFFHQLPEFSTFDAIAAAVTQ